MPYVASTLACDNCYTSFIAPSDNNGGSNTVERRVLIKGGAGINDGIRTPDGILTSVTEDELDFLDGIIQFKNHVKGGFLKVIYEKAPVKKVAADMNKGDNSAALTDADYKEGGRLGSNNAAPLYKEKGKK